MAGTPIKGLEHYFDWQKFLQGKEFMLNGLREWLDFETKKHLGTIAEVIIFEDKIPYRIGKDGKKYSNRFATLEWKIEKDIDIPVETMVVPVGATVTLWSKVKGGEKNNLSIRVTDIKVVQRGASAPMHTSAGSGKSLS